MTLEEKAMPSLVDQDYIWKGFGNGLGNWDSRCRIRIFQPHPEQQVVIASDLGIDASTSITSCADGLATLVVEDFDLDPVLVLWIEHYPYLRQIDPPAEFSRVEFEWNGRQAAFARWAPISQQEAEALCGWKL